MSTAVKRSSPTDETSAGCEDEEVKKQRVDDESESFEEAVAGELPVPAAVDPADLFKSEETYFNASEAINETWNLNSDDAKFESEFLTEAASDSLGPVPVISVTSTETGSHTAVTSGSGNVLEADLISNAGSEASSVDDDSPLEELFAAVMTASDDSGRSVSQIFQLLPSKDEYPDYYEYIKEPIDLKMIGTKICNGSYNSITDLEKDLILMVKNAKYYNEPGSQVYKDANFMRKIISAKKSEIEQRKYQPVKTSERIRAKRTQHTGQKWSAIAASLKYEAVTASAGPSMSQSFMSGDDAAADEANDSEAEDERGGDTPMWLLYESVKNFQDDSGNTVSGPFMRLPNRRFYPDYYQEIKTPISLAQIHLRIRNGHYRDSSQMVEDLNTMFENAKKYNRPDSKIYENTCKLQKHMFEKAKSLLNYKDSTAAAGIKDEDDDEDEDSEVDDSLLEEATSKILADESLKLEDITVPDLEISKQSINDPENEDSNDVSNLHLSTASIGNNVIYTPTGLTVSIKKKVSKRLVTGYIIFASEVRKSVVQANPDCNFGDISRIIGTEWKNLPAEVKAEYEKKAQKQNEVTAKEAAREAAEHGPASPSSQRQVIQNAVYECHWEHKCDFQCEDTADLLDHLTNEPDGHAWKSYWDVREKEELIFQCLFHGCGRVKKGAAPFPSIVRLIRHIKEVHVTKQNPKSIPPEKRGKNFLPSKNNPHPQIISTQTAAAAASSSNDQQGEDSIPPSPGSSSQLNADIITVPTVYECHWENKCDFMCEESSDLHEHLLGETSGHVYKTYQDVKDQEDKNIFQCLFTGCGRVKKGVPPFPCIAKLLKHVKDVHVTKQIPKPINPDRKSRNYLPSKNNPNAHLILQQQAAQQALLLQQQQQQAQSQQITLQVTQAPLHQAVVHQVTAAGAPSTTGPTQMVSTGVQVETMEPLFMKPTTPQLVHSNAYLKYIERLKPDSGCRHVSNWEKQLSATSENTTPDQSILPVHWLSNGAGNHGNVVNALWALRNFMFQDCLTLARSNNSANNS